MVKFWEEEESPCFNNETHGFMECLFTRDHRLKDVAVRMRQMMDSATSEVYMSFELSIMEPIETPDPEWADPSIYVEEQVTPSTKDPSESETDRINQDLMGNLKNA